MVLKEKKTKYAYCKTHQQKSSILHKRPVRICEFQYVHQQ